MRYRNEHELNGWRNTRYSARPKYLYRIFLEVLLVFALLLNPFGGVLGALEALTPADGEGEATTVAPIDGEEPLDPLAAIAAPALAEIAPTAFGDEWTVTFKAGTQAVGGDVVIENVEDGTLANTIAPTMVAKPGYRFNGWTPAITATTAITSNMVFTAQWATQTLAGPIRDWPAALAAMPWSVPADALRLEFDDVSNNKHTYLDYVYLQLDDVGNATLFFLAFSDNKKFEVAGSYMQYANLPGTVVGRHDIMSNPGALKMFRVFKVEIPASLVWSTIINGSPELYIVNEDNRPHSIWAMPLKFTNISFVTEHWLYDGIDSTDQPVLLRLRTTVPGIAPTGAQVTAQTLNFPGYTRTDIDYPLWKNYPASGLTIASGTVPGGGTRLVLRLYYLRDDGFYWVIKGLTGDASTTTYNGGVQWLSDLLPADTHFYEIEWPNDGNHYQFIPGTGGEAGVMLANPHGTNVGVYYQSLELVEGYQVLFRPGDADDDWQPDPLIYPDPAHRVQDADGLWWADIHDDLGAAVIIHGQLTIKPRPVTITTATDEKKFDGVALTNDTYEVTKKVEDKLEDRLIWNGLIEDGEYPHKVGLVISGSQLPVGSSDNECASARIYFTVDEGGAAAHDIDVTNNYEITTVEGTLTVHPVVTYAANYPSGSGIELGTVPLDSGGNKPTGSNGYSIDSTVTVLGNVGGLSKTGYTFVGWARSAEALGAEFAVDGSGNIVGPAGFTITANTTLYGVWEAKAFHQVFYQVTGDAPASASPLPETPQSHQCDATVTVAGNLTTTSNMKDGLLGVWSFIGWTTTDATISGGSFVMPNTDVTLTGTWSFTPNDSFDVTYTVTSSENPATVANMPDSPLSHQQGATVAVQAIPTTTATENGSGVLGTWTFSGWTTNDAAVSGGSFTMPGKNVVLTGYWVFTPNDSYNVMYTIVGDRPTPVSGMPISPQPHQCEAEVLVAGNPSTTSNLRGLELGTWKFDGWTTNDVTVADGRFEMPEADVTFVGTWTFTPNPSYRVIYVVRGDEPATVQNMPARRQSRQSGATVTVAGNPTTTETSKDGVLGTWTFLGWRTSDVRVSNGSFTMPRRNVTFVGQWRFTPNPSYNVIYTIEGDIPTPQNNQPATPVSHQRGATVTVQAVPTTTATDNGSGVLGTYSFSGWSVQSGGVGIAGGSFTMPDNAVVIGGRWTFTPNPTYNVTYTITGPVPAPHDNVPLSPQPHQQGATVTVASYPATTARTKDGYRGTWTFDGWTVTSGGVDISSGSFTMPSNAVAITGSWSFKQTPIYTVFYYGNGNTAGVAPMDTQGNALTGNNYYVGSRVTVLGQGDLAKTGYTFVGWATSQAAADAGTVTYRPAERFHIIKSMTLYAVWEINRWDITYSYDGFVPTDAPGVAAHGRTGELFGSAQTVAPAPTAVGYDFNGWTTTDVAVDGSGGFTMPDRDVAFVGSWSAQALAINYVYLDGAAYVDQNRSRMVADKVTSGVYAETVAYAPDPVPHRTGYVFEGWYADSACAGPQWVFGASGTALTDANGVVCDQTNTLTLYAKWRAIQYTIYFDANGGQGSAAPWVGTIDGIVTLPRSSFSRALHTLIGFDPHPNGLLGQTAAAYTGTSFVLTADEIDALFGDQSTEATLYAIWKKNAPPPSPKKPAVPKTGDATTIAPLMTLLATSMAALGAYAVLKVRRKELEHVS